MREDHFRALEAGRWMAGGRVEVAVVLSAWRLWKESCDRKVTEGAGTPPAA